MPDAPRVPDGAGFPAPVTDEERVAVGHYLDWLAELGASDSEVRRRLRKIGQACVVR